MQDTERRPPINPPSDEDYIDLGAMTRVIWKRRRLVMAIAGVGLIGSILISLAMPNTYTAKATIMPADSSSDRLSLALSSLGALGGLASQAGVGLKGSVSDKFVALLKSRIVAENVIGKHHLMPVLFPDRWDPAASAWKPLSSFPWSMGKAHREPPTVNEAIRRLKEIVITKVDPKAGLIEISVKHTDPEAAANIANHYVIELNSFLQGNSFTSAKQNRDFLEKQLQNAASELRNSEDSLKRFQEEHRLVSLDAQAQASVQTYAALKAQLIAKEMELGLQERSIPEGDVQVLGLRQEVSQLEQKLSALESGTSGGLISFKDAPKLGMRFAQLTRDLMVRQKVYELLTQQFELAKIDEAKEILSFQVIDKAVPPDLKSGPKRSLIITIGLLISISLASLLALALDRIQTGRKTM